MRKLGLLTVLAALIAGTYGFGNRTVQVCEGFLPENDMEIAIGSLEDKGITPEQFNEVLDVIKKLYDPVLAAKGKTLQINRLWSNNTVNASAQQRGSTWIINMYGGLARHGTITQDGFALVACHEMAHHIGGAPKVQGWLSWASNEGQSDYIANGKCLRQVFLDIKSKGFTRMATEDEFAQAACESAFPGDSALCLRNALSGMSVAKLFQELRNETKVPSFATPDQGVVSRTNDRHPATQCRIDTYFQGSLCTKPVSEGLSDTDPAPGTCMRAAGYTSGVRPLCWFKPPAAAEGMASFGGKVGLPVSLKTRKSAFGKLGSSQIWDGI